MISTFKKVGELNIDLIHRLMETFENQNLSS